MNIFFNKEFNLDYIMKTFARGILINTKWKYNKLWIYDE